jgi:FkbM family methyltransferase
MTDVSTPWGTMRPGALQSLCIATMRRGFARGALRKALCQLLHRLGPRYDVEVNGLKFRCRAIGNTIELRTLYGLRKVPEVALITRGLPTGGTFVDIGANCGVFALHAAQVVGPSGHVLAIEPNPGLVEQLRFHVESNGIPNITVAPVAVGPESGTATLHIASHHLGRSSLHDIADSDTSRTVPVEPLLGLLTANGIAKIDAMKIDIEGYEDRALMPFFASAPRDLWPRRLLIETLGRGGAWERDCISHLTAVGYAVEWDGKKDALLVRQ